MIYTCLKQIPIVFILFLVPLGYVAGTMTESRIIGIAAMTIAVFSWYKPHWVLLSLIALAPIARSPQAQVLSPDLLSKIKILFALILGLAWWTRKIIDRTKDTKNRIPVWIVIFLSIWLIQGAFSTFNAVNSNYMFVDFGGFLGAVTLFLITYQSNGHVRNKIVSVVIISAVGISLLSLLQFMIVEYNIPPFLKNFVLSNREQEYLQMDISSVKTIIYRVSGTFPHPNNLGFYLALVIPFVCALIGVKNQSVKTKWLLCVSLLLLIAGLFVSNSRASILGVVLAAGYLGLHRRYRWLAVFGIAAVFALVTLYSILPEDFFAQMHKIGRLGSGLSSREHVWSNTMELISKFPWLGAGPGNFAEQYFSHFGFFIFDNQRELLEQMFSLQTQGQDLLIQSYHAHNEYLKMMAEHGILVLPVFLWGAIMIIFHCEKKAGLAPDSPWERPLALAAASAVVGLMAIACFDCFTIFTRYSLNLLASPLLALGLRVRTA